MRHCSNRSWNIVVNVMAASAHLTGEARQRPYRSGGIRSGTTQIRPGCWFCSNRISFGADGMINQRCQFENREFVATGDRCYLGPEVMILTSSHAVGSKEQRAAAYAGSRVTIHDGCWIGARATILPGVSLGEGCVIAAGSVVARSTAGDGLYGGVPARRIRDLHDDERPSTRA
jgi:maltose O-acetyltransferase